MNKLLLLIAPLFICSFAFAQYSNGIGFNVNAGYTSRLNASLCFETRIKGNLLFRANAGFGNFLPFNVSGKNDRIMLPTRFDEVQQHHNKHIDLSYNGYFIAESKSEMVAPEFKAGVIYMTGNFRKRNRTLTGLYLGYQTSFAFVTQSYTNTYTNEKLRASDEISGTAFFYSWSPVNVLLGYKKLIGDKTTIDIGVEQSLGFVFNKEFESQKDFYFHPYSGLKFDLSVGVRRIF